jgi:hypothetical protein
MKALSLTQPWAHAVVHLGKRIENRDWRGCSFRGPVLIHAAKSVGTIDDFDETIDAIIDVCRPTVGAERLAFVKPMADMHVGIRGRHHAEGVWQPSPLLKLGGIIGRARVDGVIRNEADFAAYAKRTSNGDYQRAWWFGGFALILVDVQSTPFVPCKGALGFFHVDDAWLAEQLNNAAPPPAQPA